MESYYQYRVNNQWPSTVKREKGYFDMRFVWLDMRGPCSIAADSHWGNRVTVITRSHDTSKGEFDVRVEDKPVTVERGAQVYSNAILYNCHIKHHAAVACGAVVRNMTVEPWTMVEGNPARVVKCWAGKEWINWYDGLMKYDEENEKWKMIALDWSLPNE